MRAVLNTLRRATLNVPWRVTVKLTYFMFTSSVFLTARGVIYSTHVRVGLSNFYTSSCETPLNTVAVHSYISLSTREPQTQRFTRTKLSLHHLAPFFFYIWVCCHFCWLRSICLCPVQAVRLESAWSDRVRYMVVVYTSGRQDTEENILLGIDFTNKDWWGKHEGWVGLGCLTPYVVFSPSSKSCSIGMVLPLWSDTKIHLDGDGWVQAVMHPPVAHTDSAQSWWKIMREWPTIVFAPQGLHRQHGGADPCLQTCVSAGYVVSHEQVTCVWCI